ncbi:MAG: GGDEF domain-containing protein [Treponema sp.]|nr:GGDEF domain-containing protein [Treponema sp.]
MLSNFNYYGYDKQTYKDCVNFIRTTNRKHIAVLNSWFVLVNLFYSIFSALNIFGLNQERVPFYIIFFIIALAFEAFLIFAPKKIERHHTISLIFSLVIMLGFGILSSVAQPYMPASIFLILFAVSSLSYIAQMSIMLTVGTLFSALFIVSSYMFKTFSIAYNDTYNIVIVYTLSIALHYSFQRTRIHQFILYQHDLQIQKELEIKSSFDALTGLLNRGKFFSVAAQVLRNNKDEYLALCLIDLDGFKEINDNLGHQMGDKAIQITGNTIIELLNFDSPNDKEILKWELNLDNNLAGRLGGDEFILLIKDCKNDLEVVNKVKNILEKLNKVNLEELEGIHASIGITRITKENNDIDSAYKRADDALYISKRSGKNQIHIG